MYWKEILDIYERMGVENIIPIAHTRIKPNIKVLLDESGNFVGATLNEQDRFTIPCTIVFVPYRGIYFLYPASRTPLFIRVPELFCGAKFKNCFSFSISYACAAFSLILCSAAQNSFYCRENSILPIPISYNSP